MSLSIPPKWLREKMAKKEPLTKEESLWLKKQSLMCKSKEELVKIILEGQNDEQRH